MYDVLKFIAFFAIWLVASMPFAMVIGMVIANGKRIDEMSWDELDAGNQRGGELSAMASSI